MDDRLAKNRERLYAWRAKNPERVRELAAKWRKENPEKFAASNKAWRAANELAWRAQKQAYAERTRLEACDRVNRWRAENPSAAAGASARRRAAKRLAVPPWSTLQGVKRAYAEAEELSRLTGVPHQVDHIVPLRSPLVCGLHVEDNLAVLPAAVNLAKSNKVWPGGPATLAENRATLKMLKEEGRIQTTRNDLTNDLLRCNVQTSQPQTERNNMANDTVDILFPAGRLIMGSCYTGSDKDSKGQPRVVKTGPNAGKPSMQFFQGIAVPKTGEQHWSQTPWGQQILAIGAAAFPNFYQNPAFAWKIDDGDSTVPNKSNRRPCDSEGAPGHWLLKFSSSFAPKIFQQPQPGTFVELATPDAVKTGYWVQMSGSVKGNGSSESPGIYLNSGMVLFVKADKEISSGPDAATAFAGAAVSQALPGVAAAPMPFGGAAPALPGLPGTAISVAALPPPALAVQPNPGFLAVPGAAAAPGLPGAPAAAMPMAPPVPMAPPPVPAEPALTPAGVSSGFSYAQYKANGWSDAQMRASGIIA